MGGRYPPDPRAPGCPCGRRIRSRTVQTAAVRVGASCHVGATPLPVVRRMVVNRPGLGPHLRQDGGGRWRTKLAGAAVPGHLPRGSSGGAGVEDAGSTFLRHRPMPRGLSQVGEVAGYLATGAVLVLFL